MYRALVAHTDEIDDVDFAIEDLMRQIDPPSLLPNSVGIVYCDPGFHFSGVIKALAERLPFPLLGSTTITAAVAESNVSQILALIVITADDLGFGVSLSDALVSEDDSVVTRAFDKAKAESGGDPSLILCYYPLVSEYDRDRMMEHLSSLAPGIPVYGTLTVSPSLDSFSEARVLHCGEAYEDRMSLLLIRGDINPRFFLGTFSEEKYLKDKGVITLAKENRIVTINEIPAKEYFTKIGLSEDDAGNLLFPELFPLILDFHDGSAPFIRAMLTNLEDGSVVLNGGVREGATLSVGAIDMTELKVSVDKTLEALKAAKGYSVAIIHSCAARYFVAFGYDSELEVKAVKSHIAGDNLVPYVFCYSGGEICPIRNPDGSLTNRVNTYTFSACVF
jgi:hypothetical protein